VPDVKALEEAVQALPPADLAEFRRWFAAFDSVAWEGQIEADLAGGKLDALISEAADDLSSSTSTRSL
jgi:hypothetical protein